MVTSPLEVEHLVEAIFEKAKNKSKLTATMDGKKKAMTKKKYFTITYHYYKKKYVWKYAFSDLEMQSIDVIKYRINM